ncbi:hypothetical protein IWX48DRAFT_72390 [Phyllosticta citricarpa]
MCSPSFFSLVWNAAFVRADLSRLSSRCVVRRSRHSSKSAAVPRHGCGALKKSSLKAIAAAVSITHEQASTVFQRNV